MPLDEFDSGVGDIRVGDMIEFVEDDASFRKGPFKVVRVNATGCLGIEMEGYESNQSVMEERDAAKERIAVSLQLHNDLVESLKDVVNKKVTYPGMDVKPDQVIKVI